jgi:hypothetical protein
MPSSLQSRHWQDGLLWAETSDLHGVGEVVCRRLVETVQELVLYGLEIVA